ncbi:protein C10 [Nilaparvata lugens]|uniref:protein C10 n=1 Tax=Nilaparvata lugens TaxID=108931 RepID=UPI000B980B2D|nr:protein C10 [Nilaparvata lugens]
MSVSSVNFNAETAKAALTDILATLNNEENSTKLEEAKENVGNDMLKMMQYIFPLVVQIQMDVIKKYGFTDNREGIIQFTQHIVAMEKEDPCIADLHSQLRAIFLPPVSIATDASL